MAEAVGHEPIAVAVIGRPRGLGGECHVAGIGQTLAIVDAPVHALVGRSVDDVRPLVISEIKDANKGFVCRFEGVSDRTGAEALRNLVVYLPLEELPELEDGEYYHFQLEGLRVVDGEGGEIGVVKRVHNYPTVDALEVARQGEGSFLLPIRDETVEKIDCAAGVVRVRTEALEELM